MNETLEIVIQLKARPNQLEKLKFRPEPGLARNKITSRQFNIPEKLVKLISLTLNDTKMRVKIQRSLSEPVEVKNGVRQGDALACLLFNLALEKNSKEFKN